MARLIREPPVLKGEDAFNFEMRRLEVEQHDGRVGEEHGPTHRLDRKRLSVAICGGICQSG